MDDDQPKKRKHHHHHHHDDGDGEGDDDDDASQSVREDELKTLLLALSKEQLVALIQDAAQRHSDVLKALRKKADEDPTPRTIFVRGLASDTRSEALRKVFSKYGDVEEAVVVTDRKTQRGRGYGFVTFLHTESALRALKEPMHTVEGRVTACGPAGQGQGQGQGPGLLEQEKLLPEDLTDSKIYVSNVPEDMTASRLHKFFAQYGEISEGPFGFHSSGKSKGYALIVYKTSDGAKQALREPVKTIDGHMLRCLVSETGSKVTEPSESMEGPSAAPLSGPSSGIAGLGGYGHPYGGIEPSATLPAGLALNPAYAHLLNNHLTQGLKPVTNLSNLGLGLGASLNPSLSMDPSLAASMYPSLASLSSNGIAQGLLSGISHGFPPQGGSALGMNSLGAHSGGLAAYPAQLAAYTRLSAAPFYNAANGFMAQAGANPGTAVPAYPTAHLGMTASERAQIAGALGSLASYYNR